MVKRHKKIRKFCPLCGEKHTESEHDQHGKGAFSRFPRAKKATKAGRKMSAKMFKTKMNKLRKQRGLPPIK